MQISISVLVALMATCASTICQADTLTRADSHAPVGVMGDHTHAAGEWMFSYRFMSMDMAGNLQGSESIAPDTIATSEPNRFFGMPGQPPTLRIVPLDMQMDMHMLGLMYAPTDWVTLMVMANYRQNSMNHRTYQGGMGTTVLGNFNAETSGWGDSSVTGLFRLAGGSGWRAHLTAGLSLPTGSNDEQVRVLAPTGMQPVLRAPYPMQLSSGTFDPIIGATAASDGAGPLSWGVQWRSLLRVADNDDDYQLGDEHRLTGWLAWAFTPAVSVSGRAEYFRRGNIAGIDPDIMGPVQTADPDRQASARTDLAVGLNVAGQGALSGWRLGLEYAIPVRQDLDGPQLEIDSQWLIGIQKTVD